MMVALLTFAMINQMWYALPLVVVAQVAERPGLTGPVAELSKMTSACRWHRAACR